MKCGKETPKYNLGPIRRSLGERGWWDRSPQGGGIALRGTSVAPHNQNDEKSVLTLSPFLNQKG